MRHDIFVKRSIGDYGSGWQLYCAAVLPSQAVRIADTLEAQGETVRIMQCKSAGRLIYESAGLPKVYRVDYDDLDPGQRQAMAELNDMS